jgi:3',5'-cyclic AMP phosphodiesterase CpdA
MRRIAHISDLHFGRHSDVVAEALFDSITTYQPDVIALSGDFTQRARTSEFAAARTFLDRLPQHKVMVPGNHDVPLYDLVSRFLRPLTRYNLHFGTLGAPANFYADDEIAMLGLNTARSFTRKNGRVSAEQIQDIASVLGPLPSTTFKILVTHHPLASPEGAPVQQLAGRARSAMDAVKKAGVHLLLSGHHHRAVSGGNVELEAGGSVLVLHAGTAISTRTRGGDANSYNLLDIAGDDVSVRLMEHGASDFQEASLVRFAFTAGRWMKAS